ncbi:MAG TPA: ATP-binding protein [Pyrinomonadaceae bacterium]
MQIDENTAEPDAVHMRFQLLSIRARLLYLTLGLLIPLLLAGLFSLWELRNSSRSQLDESLRQQADLAAAAFEQRILAYKQTLEAVSVLTANTESRSALQDYLDSVVQTRRNWIDIQIVNAEGEIVLTQSSKASNLSPFSYQALIQEAARENAFVISTEQFGNENLALLTVVSPVANGNFVLARINGSSVSEVFKPLNFPEDNIIAIFDKNNRLLYRSRVSPEQMALDVSGTPLLTALNDRQEGTIEVESPYDKIARVYGLARVEAIDSAVLVGVPSARLYEPARKQFVRQLLLGLLFSFVGITAAYGIALSITRPLGALTRAARRFGAGDTEALADVGGDSAVGELSNTFNQMAAQISVREDELKTLDRLKSEFVSSVSHELRTPLTTIKTLARVLQSDRVSTADRIEYLETIMVECDRQIDLVRNLLDLSRIESGSYRVSLSETDVWGVLSNSVDGHRGAAKSRNIKLILKSDQKPLPTALSDPDALSQLLSDIIDNAIKYSSEGGEIVVAARQAGHQIAIEVSDNGCGIARQDLPHIFEKFYRGRPVDKGLSASDKFIEAEGADNVTFNEAPGVGLGLYLVQSLALQIGAEIKVESPAPGQSLGTKFTIFLPIASEPR